MYLLHSRKLSHSFCVWAEQKMKSAKFRATYMYIYMYVALHVHVHVVYYMYMYVKLLMNCEI